MTDIRARLIDVLSKPSLCSTETPESLANILLSLPGIAIVELPDAAGISSQHIRFGLGTDCEYDCCPPWVRDDETNIDFGLDEVRRYAAALLAAANAADPQEAG